MSRFVELISSMSVSSVSERNSEQSKASLSTACYQVDQQVKLMDLQAEVELLLVQLQRLKQQKEACDRE